MAYDQALDDHIFNIVQNQNILEQIDLQNELKERGYDIPQATLSRRLKKLKIAKVAGVYKIISFNTPSLPLVLNIQISDFGLIVLHTHPGSASSLAIYLDKKFVSFSTQTIDDKNILGTIAGDDTVLLIIRNKSCLNHVLQLLEEEFPYLEINS